MQWKCVPFKELSLDELYQLLMLRQEIFVVEQTCPYLDADGKDDKAWHLMGFDEANRLVAYARILPQGISYADAMSIGRIVTAASVRGTGCGRMLVQWAINYIKQEFNNSRIRISAQTYLIRFYQSFGFQTVGEGYLEDDIPHIQMVINH